MKNKFLAYGFWLCSIPSLWAQLNDGGSLPYSLRNAFANPIATTEAPAFDKNIFEREDAERATKGQLYRYGRVLPVAIDPHNNGTWTTLSNGDRIWRIRITSRHAQAISLYFNYFELPEGATMHIYNDDRSHIIGGFGAHNNHQSQQFATELIAGEAVIIEYYEPANVQNLGGFQINGIGHAYRDSKTKTLREFGDAGRCQVNVNCSEGSGKTNQRDAVARISVKVGQNLGWCTGALVNNVRQDGTPYFLTAMHCGTDANDNMTTQNDINQWLFYFNYQASGCTTPSTEPSSNTLTGATLRSHSHDAGGNAGSDFILLQLFNTPPLSYNTYYAGWDNRNTAVSSGYGIHHPSGDIKKISTFNTQVTSDSWGTTVSGTHWTLDWTSTTNGDGTTEGGSSGSPLFNSTGLIIGTLTGGASDCSGITGPDSYGKFAYHWISNGANTDYRLKPWLDPDNTGATTLSGVSRTAVAVVRTTAQPIAFTLQPNPSNGQTIIMLPSALTQDAEITVSDALGRIVHRESLNGAQNSLTLQLGNVANGIYFVSLHSQQTISTQRLTLSR